MNLDNNEHVNRILNDRFYYLTGLKESDLQYLFKWFDKEPRFYHTSEHVERLCFFISRDGYGDDLARTLYLAAVFHDAVYDPKSRTNEADSVEFFMKFIAQEGIEVPNKRDVIDVIMDTATHVPRSNVSEVFSRYDLQAFFAVDHQTLLRNELGIRREFAWVDWDVYKTKRLEILDNLYNNALLELDDLSRNNIRFLKAYIATSTPRIAIYPGSFSPFHVGHENIYDKAAKIFDKVILALGNNPEKNLGILPHIPEGFDYRQVDFYESSLIEYVKSKKYPVTIIRGLRNSTDMQYELNQYRWLQELHPDVQVVSIFCDKEFEHVSSSALRSLENYEDYREIVKGMVL
jgi:pantetheine-phosphate adenylyltransferase